MKPWNATAALLLASAALLPAQTAPPLQCSGGVSAAAPVRVEGGAELLADYLVTCTGGTPTGGQQTVPAYTLTLTFNTNVTSRLLSSNWSEALVLVDEPAKASQLACTAAGGVCTVQGTGSGTGTYSGAAGRPNIFQAQVVANNPRQIVVTGFPLDPPGSGTRVLRFTNLKVNADRTLSSIQALLSVSGANSVPISNPTQVLGLVQTGATFQTRFVQSGPSGITQFTVSVAEAFATAFKTRTAAAYAGTDASPAPVDQSVPGQGTTVSETGFYNSALPNIAARGNLGIAGLADTGTRIMVAVGPLPSGVTLSTSSGINLVQGGGNSGFLRLISTDATGSGSFKPSGACCNLVALSPDANGTARAVFEVLSSSPQRVDGADIPFVLTYGAAPATVPSLTVSVGLAPASSVTTADLTAPSPRFNSPVQFPITAITISPATLPPASPGTPYSVQFTASGGYPPYIWALASGLPSGLTFSGSGLLSGTPQSAGAVNLTIVASDSAQNTATNAYNLTISTSLQIAPAALPNGSVGIPYSQTLTATGGTSPYSFALASGSLLPSGLTLAASGLLSGTPAIAATASFTVNVSDARGLTGSRAYTLTIASALSITTQSPLPDGAIGTSYSASLTATGGTPPYTFSIAGSAPAGLTLSAAGLLSGTPASAGTVSFTVSVKDSASNIVSKLFTVTFGTAAPVLTISRTSLDFTAIADGDAPPPQDVAVISVAGPGVNFGMQVDAGAANTPAPTWISVRLSSGITPAGLVVTVDQTGLAAGTYGARIRVTLPGNSSQAPADVTVTLKVVAATQQLSVSPEVLKLQVSDIIGDLQEAFVVVRNSGGGAPIPFAVTTERKSSWIADISPSSGRTAPNGPVIVRVRINAIGLAGGGYRDVIHFAWSGKTIDVPIALFVADPGPVLSLDVTGLRFQSKQGGGYAQALSVRISNTGDPGTSVNWTAEILAGATWMTLNDGPSSGSIPAGKTQLLRVNGLPASADRPVGGSYGLIRISDAKANNSPQYVVVVLDQAPSTAPTLPDFPPGPVVVSIPAGSAPQNISLNLYASTPTPKSFYASAVTYEGSSWLSTSSTGTSFTGSPGVITAQINPAGLSLGIHKAQINVAMSGVLRTKDITVIVTPPGASGVSAGADRPGASPSAGCAPTRLAITQAGIADSFSVPAGWPATVIVQLTDDCGTPITNGSVSASFSNGDPPLTLDSDRTTGAYSATWQPGIVTQQMTVTVRASVGVLTQATAQISGTVNPNAAPILSKGGTVNNLNPLSGGALAPGTVAAVYGSGLAGETASVPAVPLPTTFRGTSILVGSFEAPLFFVSDGQVNVQIPNELKPNRQYPVIVNANGALTVPDTIDVVPFMPGVVQFGDGVLAAQHAADAQLVTASNPAKPGEFLTMYLVGMGATNPNVPSGMPAPRVPPFAEVTEKATVTVDGQPSTVGFAGMTPDGVGLFQINFQVPAGAATGNLEVIVKQGSVTANITRLPVQR